MFHSRLLSLITIVLSFQLSYAQSEITTEKLILTGGASTDYILKTDAQGNASWVDPATMFTGGVSSNWTLNGSNLYNANTGYVGVGTNNPEAKFTIAGGSDVNLTSNPFLQLGLKGGANMALDNNEIQTRDNGLAGNIFIQKEGGNASLVAGGGQVGIGTGTTQAKLTVVGGENLTLTSQPFIQTGFMGGINMAFDNNEIQVRNNEVGSKLFLQRHGGNASFVAGGGQVGIGTEIPEAKLTVVGGSDVTLTSEPFLQVGFMGGLNMAVDNNEIQVRDNGVGETLFLQKDGGNASLVSHGGQVAIGKATPTSTLDVNGTLRAGIIQTNSTKIDINKLGSGDRNAIVDFYTNDVATAHSARIYRVAGPNGNFRIENTNGTGSILFSNGLTNRAAIKSNGKFIVGALTLATPGNYKLYVEDGILTERVKIATVNTADWADYVFEEDYNLHSLEEVAGFVKENKHLPNVPSAKDVNENGYELQKMDSKLLEKIEELYLLTIQLNEEKNELKKENEQLELSIKTINARLEKLENN